MKRALIVGAGGLGCPASLVLAHAGIDRMTVVDADVIEVSNLHRQLWQRPSDLGKSKAACAASRLRQAFPGLRVEARVERVTAENAEVFFAEHDIVIDGTDDWRTKFALSDAAVKADVPLVYGGVLRTEGQAMVVSRQGVCLRCLFEIPEMLITCAQAGVLGSVAGVVGAQQGRMALDALSQAPQGTGSLWIVDAAALTQRRVPVRRAEDCTHG